MKKCNKCDKKVKEYYWSNISKGFCSLDCTNEYLEQEGFEPINDRNKSAPLKDEYKPKKLRLFAVSECVHPLDELISGDEGLFCCKCQKYVRTDAHIH